MVPKHGPWISLYSLFLQDHKEPLREVSQEHLQDDTGVTMLEVELMASPQAIEKDLGFVVRAMITPLLCWGLEKKVSPCLEKNLFYFLYLLLQ